jgi:hypothetical protein
MKIRPFGLALAVVFACGTAMAEPPPGTPKDGPPLGSRAAKPFPGFTRVERAERVNVLSQARRIDVNSINSFVTNYGSFANDIEAQSAGLFFPKGTIKTAVYASGIWLVGKVGGELRAAIAEYSQEFVPGTMVAGQPDDPSRKQYTVYKVNRYAGSPSDTDHVERDAGAVARDRTLDPLVHHSWSEYMSGAAPYGAPVRDYRFPDPNVPGDSITVTGPDVRGDQMLWSVYNDAEPTAHSNGAGSTAPLGVEVRQTTFGFDRQGALGNTIFLQYDITNRSTTQIDSVYVQLWSDPDLGGAADDLVGCDTLLSLGYVYNATNTDQLYGDRPPAVGYDFFQGPKVGNTVLPLTAFVFYQNGTDPTNVQQTFNYMKGLQANGTPFTDNNDNPTPFYASGDPVTGTGYLDSNPSDRRFMLISGPFTLPPDSTQTIVGAVVIAQGGDRLSSVTGLKFFDIKAQTAFDVNFDLPSPPPQPKVTYSTGHNSVNLLWDSGSRFNYTPTFGYQFEGYNVYQGASISGPWKRIKTFDLVNGIKDVRDTVFDVNTGLLITDQPTAFGGDNGVQYSFSTNQDVIHGGPLRQGMTYYYAVTAYSVNETPPRRGFEKVLETSFVPTVVTVQQPASGTDVAAARVFEAYDHRANAGIPATTDHVVVDIVDPAAITGHTYCVSFAPLVTPVIADGDTITTSWSLRDSTTGQVLIANQIARTTSPDYAPVDGMNVKVLSSQVPDSTTGPVNDVYFSPARPNLPFDSEGPFGLTFYRGGWDYAANFLAGIDPGVSPELFPNAELRFGVHQKAYRYYRDELADGSMPPGGRAYNYGGFGDVSVQAWDTDHNQQLEIGFVERRIVDSLRVALPNQPATYDGTWNPDGSSLGGREYLAISHRPYTGNPVPELAQDGAIVGADDQWLYNAALVRTAPSLPGDKFVIVAGGNHHGTTNDTLCFATQAPAHNVVSLQHGRLQDIRVVPNPYYSRSAYEISSFNKIIKFMNMPETATVRIYNLAGHLVRTLQKVDAGSSILEWDLENENRLPVASGVYVYHVEVPGAGSTVGRVVVFMEKERLQNF